MKKKKKLTPVAKGTEITIAKKEALKSMPGGSNTGKYKNVKSFAGKAGGTSPYSYPIPDIMHASNALSRAHFAPHPEGIREAVYKKFPQLKKRAMARGVSK